MFNTSIVILLSVFISKGKCNYLHPHIYFIIMFNTSIVIPLSVFISRGKGNYLHPHLLTYFVYFLFFIFRYIHFVPILLVFCSTWYKILEGKVLLEMKARDKSWHIRDLPWKCSGLYLLSQTSNSNFATCKARS